MLMIILWLIVICVILFGLLILYLTITEYKPKNRQDAEILCCNEHGNTIENYVSIYSWNIGYAGLGKDSDLFIDGGKMVYPPSQKIVDLNLKNIAEVISNSHADIVMLQEIDLNSRRSGRINQFEYVSNNYINKVFTYNYKCNFVPFPIPFLGRIESGLATLSNIKMLIEAKRISLPNTFNWPGSVASLKRCILETRYPIKDTSKQLIVYNFHLEAYSNQQFIKKQMTLLLDMIQKEYENGHYIIAGGDFNQTFESVLDKFPLRDHNWKPGVIDRCYLPDNWKLAYDMNIPSCRLLNHPFNENSQLYILDGFIVSPNIEIINIKNIDLQFEHSDHNPVYLEVRLKNELE